MSFSTIKQINLQDKEQLILKPYNFYYEDKKYPDNSCYELIDLKDLRNAAIKNLSMSKLNSFTHKIRRNLLELLSNTNVKKIEIHMEYQINNIWLLTISKFILKNSTIKEIELYFEKAFKINYLSRKTWSSFLNAIENRLVKINNTPFSKDNTDMNKLLYSISSIKEINNNCDQYLEYANIIKYTLTSRKYLNELIIYENKGMIDQHFFEYVIKSKTKAEINTLALSNFSSECLLNFLNNSYLFKVETLKICDYKSSLKNLFYHLFNLSDNPLNTIKRIIINNYQKEIKTYIQELLSMNDYDLTKFPKFYTDTRKEIKIEHNENNNTYNITCEFENSQIDILYFVLQFTRNTLNGENYKELLNLLLICPEIIRSLRFSYGKDDDYIIFSDPIYIKENSVNIVNKMKLLFIKFKEDNIHFECKKTININFEFKKNHQELNIFYFTILEIMIQMGIRINSITLKYCPISELADFMNKYKTFKCLNINKIYIITTKIDLKNVEKLFQYSYLIEDKIFLKFYDDEDFSFKNFIFSSLSSYNVNFIESYCETRLSKANMLYNSNDIDIFNQNLIKTLKTQEDKIFLKIIYCLYFDFEKFEIEKLNEMFSLLKKYRYYIYELNFIIYHEIKADHVRKVQSIYFETVINYKYSENKIYSSGNLITCYNNKI